MSDEPACASGMINNNYTITISKIPTDVGSVPRRWRYHVLSERVSEYDGALLHRKRSEIVRFFVG